MWRIALALLVLSLGLTTSLDPDFGWHIYLGRYMVENRELVRTLVGYNYLAHYELISHEWLAEIFMYLAYAKLGYGYLIVVTYGIALVTVYLAYDRCRRRGSGELASALALFLFFLTFTSIYGVRVQLIWLFGLSLLLWVRESVSGIVARRWWYLGIFALGINLHGGFLILAVVPLLLELPQPLHFPFKSPAAWRRYGLTAGAVAAGVLGNAYGWDLWRLSWDYLAASDLHRIIEWRSPLSWPINFWTTFLPLSLTIFLLTIGRRWKRLTLPEGLLVIFFLAQGLAHIRFLPAFFLVSLPYLANAVGEAFYLSPQLVSWKKTAKWLTTGLYFLGVLYFLQGSEVAIPVKPAKARGYPLQAMQQIYQDPQCRDGLYNPYVWGGYILGFFPDQSVFIDGRGGHMAVEGQQILSFLDSIEESQGEAAEATLVQYGLNCVLFSKISPIKLGWFDRFTMTLSGMDPDSVIINPPSQLGEYLKSAENWEYFYEDEVAVVYRRR
jgi:hypothetical protein